MAELKVIAEVPEEFLERLGEHAENRRMSISDLVVESLSQTLLRPSRTELLAEITSYRSPDLEPSAIADAVRAERDAR